MQQFILEVKPHRAAQEVGPIWLSSYGAKFKHDKSVEMVLRGRSDNVIREAQSHMETRFGRKWE